MTVLAETGFAFGCDGVQFFGAFAGGLRDVAEFLEHGQRRVDHAGTGGVAAAGLFLDALITS